MSQLKIIGHRGAKGLAEENTLRGFEKALSHNVDEIELDVRLTKDHITVLAHDPFITDPAGNELLIAEHTMVELLSHNPNLTTLDKAIQTIARRVPLIIEVKPDVAIEPIVAILKKFLAKGWQPSDFLLASFSQPILRALHRELPHIQKVVNESWSGARGTWHAKQVGTKRLAMRSWWLWNGFLAPMQKRGWQIAPYTMNEPAKVWKWQKYLYGVYTDYPDRFQK